MAAIEPAACLHVNGRTTPSYLEPPVYTLNRKDSVSDRSKSCPSTMAQDPRALLQKVSNPSVHSIRIIHSQSGAGRQGSLFSGRWVLLLWRTIRQVRKCRRTVCASCERFPHAEGKQGGWTVLREGGLDTIRQAERAR